MNLFPPAASSNAPEVDLLLTALLTGTALVLILVFGLMTLYCVRYRADSGISRSNISSRTFKFEISWTTATLVIFFGLFIWGANLYVRLYQPPSNTLKISVTGKQWMWKAEHAGGQSEINSLHLPVNRAVELLMTSEDVIHDFAIPAFRVKHDVVPGRYEPLWFTPTMTGTFHLFCTQFCGTDHSVMGGDVVVMTGPDFEKWLAANAASAGLAQQGQVLFVRYGCSGCHVAGGRGGNGTVSAPPLDGVYGHPVPLDDRRVVVADDKYIRDSILMPEQDIVSGYPNRMPSFGGVVSEADLIRIIAYIKSLAAEDGT